MPITDPQAIKFSNEVVRPLCERIRALKADIDAARAQYDGSVGTFFYNHGGEAVEDGREAEGVSRLTGNDVLAFVDVVLYQHKNLYDTTGIPAVIANPCVRSLITG